MAKPEPSIVKRSLFSWIFAAGNLKLQLLLLLIISVMVFANVLPLEMQRRIVNEAIKLRNIDLLFLYCGIFLAAVVLSSALKYLTNVFQTLITQRTTAHMRKDAVPAYPDPAAEFLQKNPARHRGQCPHHGVNPAR